MMLTKNQVRKSCLERRSKSPASDRLKIAESALHLSAKLWQGVSQVLCYAPYKAELPLLSVLHSRLDENNVRIFLPVVEAEGAMSFWSYSQDMAMNTNKWGILEPNPDIATEWDPEASTLAFVPALAVDKAGNRLGYGGGFYDRFFAQHSEVLKLAIVAQYALLAENSWEVDQLDIPVDWVATEKELINIEPVKNRT